MIAVPRHFPVPNTDVRYDHTTTGKRVRMKFRERPDLIKKFNLTITHEDLVEQRAAAVALASQGGYVSAGCGKGKTVIGVQALCILGVQCVVIVNTAHLADQWRDQFAQFTNLKKSQIGVVQGRASLKRAMKCPVLVCMVQTLNTLEPSHPIFSLPGAVLVDEAHEMPAYCFYHTVLQFNARWFGAMTATPARTDGMWFLVPWVVGKCAYAIEPDEFPGYTVLYTDVEPYNKMWRPKKQSGDNYDPCAYVKYNGQTFWPNMLNYLVESHRRQITLAHQIVRCVQEGRKVILLSDRKDQLYSMEDILCDATDGGFPVGVITSSTPMKERKSIGKSAAVILATMGCLKKGADFPRFDTLVMGTPFSSPVTAAQTAGRVLSRNNPNKQPSLVIVPYDKKIKASARCTARFLSSVERLGWEEVA